MRRLLGVLAVLGVLTLSLTACTVGEQPRGGLPGAGPQPLVLQPAPPSVLVPILDPAHLPESIAAVRSLVPATARTNEHLVVLCQGRTVVSSTAPAAVSTMPAPAPPPPLPPNPTTFLKSQQHTKVTEYNQAVTQRTASLRTRQQRQVAAWADSVNARLARVAPGLGTTCRGPGNPASLALDEAAATLASFHQSGLATGQRAVIVSLGEDASPAPPAAIPQDLLGATVIVSGFTGGSQEQAAWQGRLLAAGARRAVLLTPGASPTLPAVVSEALDGAIVRSLSADVLFGSGSATLKPAAQASLTHVLRLLTSNPAATAVVNGHTDDLATPEGNDVLSTRRARAVKAWLVARGVAGSRLQVVGDGARFPVAPNSPHGQPANRRVDIVINPVT